jgi:hypothetical protein
MRLCRNDPNPTSPVLAAQKHQNQNPTQNQQWSRSWKICEGWGFVIIVCGGKDECGSISLFNTILHLSTSFLISLAFWSRKVAFHQTKLHPSILKTPTHTYFTYLNCCWCETLISCTPPLVHVTWIESPMDKVFLWLCHPVPVHWKSHITQFYMNLKINNFVAPSWPIMSSLLLPPHITKVTIYVKVSN